MKRQLKRKPIVHHNEYTPKGLSILAENLLKTADETWRQCDLLDTAIRDDVAEGLAYIVYAAYDTKAVNFKLDTAAWTAFVETSTQEWFRMRGFAEWFCLGAGSLFRRSRPRDLSPVIFKPIKRTKKKTAAANRHRQSDWERLEREKREAEAMAAHWKRQLEQQAVIASNTQALLAEAVILWRRAMNLLQIRDSGDRGIA